MGWVDSLNFFCASLETLTAVADTLVNTDPKVPSYGAISETPLTSPGLPHTLKSLTHIHCYMDDVISAVQGGPDHQHRVFDGTVCGLKWIFPSSPGDLKDLMSMKNIAPGEGGVNLCQGGPGVDPGYGRSGSHPHREES